MLPCPALEEYGKGDEEKRYCGTLDGKPDCVVFSVGSANAWGFEKEVHRRTACEVYTFDCTVEGHVPPDIGDRVHFYPICLGSTEQASQNENYMSYDSLVRFVNMTRAPMLLKMDIEGYEYDAVKAILDSGSFLPEQIAMEVHYKTFFMYMLSWSEREISGGELAAFSEYLWNYGCYAILDRRDNPRCPHCTEILLGRISNGGNCQRRTSSVRVQRGDRRHDALHALQRRVTGKESSTQNTIGENAWNCSSLSFAIDQPHQRINSDCPRFAGISTSSRVGNGHFFGDFVFSLRLAIILNATLLYQPETFFQGEMHGSHAWMVAFLNLLEGEHKYSDVETKYMPTLLRVRSLKETTLLAKSKLSHCNTLFWGSDGICDGSCFKDTGLHFDAVKWIFRAKFMRSRYVPKSELLYHVTDYNIAWHIRVGDIELHKSDETFFQSILSQILPALQFLKSGTIRHYVFADCEVCPPPGYYFLEDLLSHPVHVANMDAEDTMYHFVNADMVVETGSSFTTIAHTVATKPVFIFTCPKESTNSSAFVVNDVVQTSCSDNTIQNFSQDELVSFIRYKHGLFNGKFWPYCTKL